MLEGSPGDMEFLKYAEVLPEVVCSWCSRESVVGEVLNVSSHAEGMIWQCPLCDKYNMATDEEMIAQLNETARMVVTGRKTW